MALLDNSVTRMQVNKPMSVFTYLNIFHLETKFSLLDQIDLFHLMPSRWKRDSYYRHGCEVWPCTKLFCE